MVPWGVVMQLNGAHWLAASLLYGSGLRLLECLRLRVKDVEFERHELIVRQVRGGSKRVTVLPENLLLPLRKQLAQAWALRERDLAAGRGGVWLPDALAVKFPRAARARGWQCVFPSRSLSVDPRGDVLSPLDAL